MTIEKGIFSMLIPDQERFFTGTALAPFIGPTRIMRSIHDLANGQQIFDLLDLHAQRERMLVLTLRVPVSTRQHEHHDRPPTKEERGSLIRFLRDLSHRDATWHLIKRDNFKIQVANEVVGNAAGTGGGVGWIHPDQYGEALTAFHDGLRAIHDMFGPGVGVLPSLMEPNMLLLTKPNPGDSELQQWFAHEILRLTEDKDYDGWFVDQAFHIQGGGPGVAERALAAVRDFNRIAFGNGRQPAIVPEWSPAGIRDANQQTSENLELLARSQWKAMQDHLSVRAAFIPGWCGADLPLRFAVACAMKPGNTEVNTDMVGVYGRVVSASGSGGEVEGEVK